MPFFLGNLREWIEEEIKRRRMDIEIIEFYPFERDKDKDSLSGTLRIKLVDFGIQILGIIVTKRKNFWHFALPGKKAIHHETGNQVYYPHVVFEDREKNKELINAIREKGRPFIEKRLDDIKNPLIFPQKQDKGSGKLHKPKACDRVLDRKEKDPTAIKKLRQSNVAKEWTDPPPRKAVFKIGSKCVDVMK